MCGKAGRNFIGKMAANFLPGQDNLFKIFNDSGSEDEFEGFDPEDLEEDIVQPQFYGLFIGVYSMLFSSRKTPLDLQFCETLGL